MTSLARRSYAEIIYLRWNYTGSIGNGFVIYSPVPLL